MFLRVPASFYLESRTEFEELKRAIESDKSLGTGSDPISCGIARAGFDKQRYRKLVATASGEWAIIYQPSTFPFHPFPYFSKQVNKLTNTAKKPPFLIVTTCIVGTLFMNIALANVETAPSESARIVAERVSPGSIQDQAVMAVLTRWASQDLPGAVSWVSQFPPGDLRDQASEQLSRIAEAQSAP